MGLNMRPPIASPYGYLLELYKHGLNKYGEIQLTLKRSRRLKRFDQFHIRFGLASLDRPTDVSAVNPSWQREPHPSYVDDSSSSN
jgi:hypothetical protein